MIYSKYFIKEDFKIPAPLTFVLIFIFIFLLARLFSTSPLPSKAKREKLKLLEIVNLYHNQAGVFWQSAKKEAGWVVYSTDPNNLDKIALDERDLQSEKHNFLNHYVLLRDLKENTTYYFKIVTGSGIVGDSQNRPYNFRTPFASFSSFNANPAYGRVIKSNGFGVENAVVVLKSDDLIPQLSLTKATGEWLIPLNNLLKKGLLKATSIPEDQLIRINIYSESGETTKVSTNLKKISPLPQSIIVGSDYNFADENNVLALVTKAPVVISQKIDILYPQENAVIPGASPIIKGTALPFSEIIVAIEGGERLVLKVRADKDGIWTAKLDRRLPTGEHTITVLTKGDKGQEVKLARHFTLAKSGEQVMGEATAAASPTTAILTPTYFPTIEPSWTMMPTLQPTAVTYPVSGINITPLAFISLGLLILGAGVLLAF